MNSGIFDLGPFAQETTQLRLHLGLGVSPGMPPSDKPPSSPRLFFH